MSVICFFLFFSFFFWDFFGNFSLLCLILQNTEYILWLTFPLNAISWFLPNLTWAELPEIIRVILNVIAFWEINMVIGSSFEHLQFIYRNKELGIHFFFEKKTKSCGSYLRRKASNQWVGIRENQSFFSFNFFISLHTLIILIIM